MTARPLTESRPVFMKRHTRVAAFLRFIAIWLINTGALMLLSWIVPGVHPHPGEIPLGMALWIALLNAVVWPLLVRFALPLGVVTLGLGPLLLNGVIVYVASRINTDMDVDTIFSGVLVALGITIINTFVTTVLGLNDYDYYYRRGMRRRARRVRGNNAETDVPGVVFLEIDGLAHDVLRRAIRDGNAATIRRWLRNGHRLMQLACDVAAQTGG